MTSNLSQPAKSESAEVELSSAKLSKISDRVIQVTYLEQEGYVQASHIAEILKAAAMMFDEQKYRLCIITGKYTLLSNDARKKITEEINDWEKMAVVVHNLGQRLMGNFVINMKGLKKLKLFNDSEKAIYWLGR